MPLNPQQLVVLRAAMDRLIPADDFPSASEAGAENYILGQLRGDVREKLPLIAVGLDTLEAEAQLAFSRGFVQLTATEQDGLLKSIENGQGRAPWFVSAQHFFDILLNLTGEGYYADPGNGGNRDGRSWEMIGYDQRLSGNLPGAKDAAEKGNIGKVQG